MSSLQRTAGARKQSGAALAAKSRTGQRGVGSVHAAVRQPKPAPTTPERRRALIEKAAYFRAARRGFLPGGEVVDWLAAEVEIDRLMESSTS
jgi:hypothetical protein